MFFSFVEVDNFLYFYKKFICKYHFNIRVSQICMSNYELRKIKLQKTIIVKINFLAIYLFNQKLKEIYSKSKPQLKIK